MFTGGVRSGSLRARIAEGPILVAPGVWDALSARLCVASGFEAVFVSGSAVSYSVAAVPDVGLVTQTEVRDRVAQIAAAAPVPVLADGDDGHGNAANVARTVTLFERAGAQAITLEDQVFPKKCGLLSGKPLVSPEVMVSKIRAALRARSGRDFLVIARTDARSELGLDAAIARARAYRDAGADAVFVEAPESEAELREIAREVSGVPLLVAMVEGGKTPLLAPPALEALGFRIAIWPTSLVRTFTRAARLVLDELRQTGLVSSPIDDLATLQRLVGLPALEAFQKEFA